MEKLSKRNNVLVILVITTVILFSCDSKQVSKRLIIDYSYSDGWRDIYSLRVFENGLGVMKKTGLDSTSHYVDSGINVSMIKSLTTEVAKQKIPSKIIDQHLQDGSSFNLYIYSKKAPVMSLYVHGDNYPAVLKKLQQYLFQLTHQKTWLNSHVDTVKYLSEQPFTIRPKIDSVKFPPPIK